MKNTLFSHISDDANGHFKLYYYAALLALLQNVAQAMGSDERALEVFPFLRGYYEQFGRFLHTKNNELPDGAAWQQTLNEWESDVRGHLPLRSLRQVAKLDYQELVYWIVIGLAEADGRFGIIFETIQGISGQTRPTLGLMLTWFGEQVYGGIQKLATLGLLRIHHQERSRPEWVLQIPPTLWDALVDSPMILPKSHIKYTPCHELTHYSDLVLPAELKDRLQAIPAMLESGHLDAVIVRGLQNNGRVALISGIAHALGRGVLVIDPPPPANDPFWHEVGALATAVNAMPIISYDMAPGEVQTVPKLACYQGGIGIVIGQTGGVNGPGIEGAVMLTLQVPDVPARVALWQQTMNAYKLADAQQAAQQLRVTSGHIERIARIAESYARLEGRHTITEMDIQQASQAVNRHALDLLASRMPTLGCWQDLIVEQRTRQELQMLEKRCLFRENLSNVLEGALAGSLNAGVRALMQGPSGTGKTMAARILAAELNKDLYRVDLAAVVNKYIGETEKNINQVLSRAEELDVILLLDEGDALLTRRTTVQTANDRYANLETNYLLQRLEAYEGILLITTNAANHIDDAFERRMDVVVNFRVPEAANRWEIWNIHLPESHQIDASLLREVARRCELTGGHIRNAVLHATVLALDVGGKIQTAHLEQGVLREYEKSGQICPLPIKN